MTDQTVEHQLRTGSTLRIVEMFGPTIQGEGADVGRAAFFLRLAGCNLTCVWCDTAFSWDPERADPQRPAREIVTGDLLAWLEPRTTDPGAASPIVRRVVLTGGEPLLQAARLVDVVTVLRGFGWSIDVETSGSVAPGPLSQLVNRFNVSPKLANSGVAERARLRLPVLSQFAKMPSATFKFVAERVEDLDEVDDLLASLTSPVTPDRVFVMAQGTDAESVLTRSRTLVDAVVARGWGLTPRWHTLLWGDEPGR